jgi:hypothetical protein
VKEIRGSPIKGSDQDKKSPRTGFHSPSFATRVHRSTFRRLLSAPGFFISVLFSHPSGSRHRHVRTDRAASHPDTRRDQKSFSTVACPLVRFLNSTGGNPGSGLLIRFCCKTPTAAKIACGRAGPAAEPESGAVRPDPVTPTAPSPPPPTQSPPPAAAENTRTTSASDPADVSPAPATDTPPPHDFLSTLSFCLLSYT